MKPEPLQFIKSNAVVDGRGYLHIFDNLPFPVQRMFHISKVPKGERRGSHAHKKCSQIIVCIKGQFWIRHRNGKPTNILHVMQTGMALLIPPMNWIELLDFTEDAICLVLCSHTYDESDYIRDYDEYLEILNG